MYTQPLGFIARRLGVDYHFSADDTQLFVSLAVANESKVLSLGIENLIHCIADIRLWMILNLLKLKDSKTDINYLSSSYNNKSITPQKLHISESWNTGNGSVRDLGFIIDTFLGMNDLVITVCRPA